MGCACSKKAVVDDDPLPNLSAKVSRQSSARYLCASIQHNISQPLSGLITAGKDNEEKVRVQCNHHHHYQQQQQQLKQHIHLNNQRQPEDQLIKPKYNAQHSDLARTVSSRRRAREAERERTASENIRNIPKHNEGEQVAAGWPAWLSAVAGEAIKGWIPRRADSFEKLDKIGQGTYSNVYKARDLESRSIVALKKVRFDTMEPESVKFMAREIIVLRRLDHPNVIKLEGLVTSRMSCSLYLVFEYMEHDLAGLAASPGVLFSEPQVKFYICQLLSGLQHCHDRNILHRDIKGSNLLLDNFGTLKIADFGLATVFDPDHNQPMTSRVVTLWYRPPELLLGATDYGVGVDLWSVGCILAELFAGKPIMPARTEVEQLHKIFKMCGSPSEEYWKKSKLPHATIFKPQQPYKRCIKETFKDFPPTSLALLDTLLAIEPFDRGTATQALKSEFFTTPPYPCDPLSLPQYPPSKEWDAKIRDEENRRRREKMRNDAALKRASGGRDRPNKAVPASDANAELQTNIQKRRVEANPKSLQSKSTSFPPPPAPPPEEGVSQAFQASKEVQPVLPSRQVPHHLSSRSGPLGPPALKKKASGEDVRMAPSRPTHRFNMSISDTISQSGDLSNFSSLVGANNNKGLVSKDLRKESSTDQQRLGLSQGRQKETDVMEFGRHDGPTHNKRFGRLDISDYSESFRIPSSSSRKDRYSTLRR